MTEAERREQQKRREEERRHRERLKTAGAILSALVTLAGYLVAWLIILS